MPPSTQTSLRIFVSGCSGVLGLQTVNLALQAGHAVSGVDRIKSDCLPRDDRFKFTRCDLLDFEAVLAAMSGCDAVIHLAALSNPGDYLYISHNCNVVMSWNILRAAAELGITRVAQASSVNAIGLVYSSKMPTFDYFPVDEEHAYRPDEPYGLSKQICELQADAIVRRYPFMRVASLRPHWCLPNNQRAMYENTPEDAAKQLWGWVLDRECARAFLLGVVSEGLGFEGHERFFITAPEAAIEGKSADVAKQFWPQVEVRRPLKDRESFFDCTKAETLLGWKHAA